jgi:hypothetical protein
MTTTLMKYILNGMLKGIEDYESMLEKEHVDPKGKIAEILTPSPPKASNDKIDFDELFKDTDKKYHGQ